MPSIAVPTVASRPGKVCTSAEPDPSCLNRHERLPHHSAASASSIGVESIGGFMGLIEDIGGSLTPEAFPREGVVFASTTAPTSIPLSSLGLDLGYSSLVVINHEIDEVHEEGTKSEIEDVRGLLEGLFAGSDAEASMVFPEFNYSTTSLEEELEAVAISFSPTPSRAVEEASSSTPPPAPCFAINQSSSSSSSVKEKVPSKPKETHKAKHHTPTPRSPRRLHLVSPPPLNLVVQQVHDSPQQDHRFVVQPSISNVPRIDLLICSTATHQPATRQLTSAAPLEVGGPSMSTPSPPWLQPQSPEAPAPMGHLPQPYVAPTIGLSADDTPLPNVPTTISGHEILYNSSPQVPNPPSLPMEPLPVTQYSYPLRAPTPISPSNITSWASCPPPLTPMYGPLGVTVAPNHASPPTEFRSGGVRPTSHHGGYRQSTNDVRVGSAPLYSERVYTNVPPRPYLSDESYAMINPSHGTQRQPMMVWSPSTPSPHTRAPPASRHPSNLGPVPHPLPPTTAASVLRPSVMNNASKRPVPTIGFDHHRSEPKRPPDIFRSSMREQPLAAWSDLSFTDGRMTPIDLTSEDPAPKLPTPTAPIPTTTKPISPPLVPRTKTSTPPKPRILKRNDDKPAGNSAMAPGVNNGSVTSASDSGNVPDCVQLEHANPSASEESAKRSPLANRGIRSLPTSVKMAEHYLLNLLRSAYSFTHQIVTEQAVRSGTRVEAHEGRLQRTRALWTKLLVHLYRNEPGRLEVVTPHETLLGLSEVLMRGPGNPSADVFRSEPAECDLAIVRKGIYEICRAQDIPFDAYMQNVVDSFAITNDWNFYHQLSASFGDMEFRPHSDPEDRSLVTMLSQLLIPHKIDSEMFVVEKPTYLAWKQKMDALFT